MNLERFQLIDRIVELKLADREIRCEATVPTESSIFEGHFPTFPLMPGVLLIEAMAQTSGWLIIALKKFERMPFLAGVRDAKFRAMVRPGQRVLLTATLMHDGSGFALTKAKGEVDGKIVCDATITFSVSEFPNPGFKAFMTDFSKTLEFPMAALAHD